jgi:hypothetical protein
VQASRPGQIRRHAEDRWPQARKSGSVEGGHMKPHPVIALVLVLGPTLLVAGLIVNRTMIYRR